MHKRTRSYALYPDAVCKAFVLLLRRARQLGRIESLPPSEHPMTDAMQRTAMKETQYSFAFDRNKSFIPKVP
jgi:hypothetical protein